MNAVLSAKSLRQIMQETETAKAREQLAREKKEQEEQRRLHEAFMAQEIEPSKVSEFFSTAVRSAAEQGKTELQAFAFPASYTTDRGRRINSGEPDWPQSLEGFAKRAYEYYERELRPQGYRVEARVLSFPEGVPGDIGIFLKW